MASIVLGSIGNTIGGELMGGFGAAIGEAAFSFAGNILDHKLMGNKHSSSTFGTRLKNCQIQSNSYGAMIPIVFGTVRIAGNIIWSSPVRETTKKYHISSGSKGGKVSSTHTEYYYYASFAISLCEGEIENVYRIWANQTLLDLSKYKTRIYKGTDTQIPDHLIEVQEGMGKTPAYRGQAYIVFEDFPLQEFFNTIPNFTFEVRRKTPNRGDDLENLVESVVIIPGCGEYVYDTEPQFKYQGNFIGDKWVQRGKARSLNQHNTKGTANSILALDQFKDSLPKVNWVAPVAAWFANSLDIKDCTILPGMEFAGNSETFPDPWQVASFNRRNAHQISSTNDILAYGGTINDRSIVRYLDELRRRNYKIMFYPMLFVDTPGKPWRGKISGDSKYVNDFFNKPNGYNNFILHYANLVKDKVDAFVIGSELIGLSKINDHGVFPAVDELIKLAIKVKEILGGQVIITYAADWSEYHHTEQGWYNMDKLWACSAIDVIGIDSYFPLTNSMKSVYDVSTIQKGWESGEGYSYYYSDKQRTKKHVLGKEYAWKNIRWWWENCHINPNGEQTAWIPKSKKIWFTEYGFPSVDCSTNQPNVFYDPTTSESGLPIHSSGTPDFKAQNIAIQATELYWKNSDMVERKFLWSWDARPYPYWPNIDFWSDGAMWLYGHWVQGKIGKANLSTVIESLCERAHLDAHLLNINLQKEVVNGLLIDFQSDVRSILELLKITYFFDASEYSGRVNFSPVNSKEIARIPNDDIIDINENAIARSRELDLPSRIDVNYLDSSKYYRISNQHAIIHHSKAENNDTLNLPFALTKMMQKILLKSAYMWHGRNA